MLLAQAVALLDPLHGVGHVRADHSNPADLLIQHTGNQEDEVGWKFAEVEAVAAALGCKDIDIRAVVDLELGLPMLRLNDGCLSCGHGDTLVVRGILGEA